MKNFNFLPLAVAALSLGFASCSNERNTELQQGGVELGLTTAIQDQARVTTQADGINNHWDASDAIGVFSATLNATNVQYTAAAAGASTSFSGGPVMIPFGTDTHNVQAYYPYSASATTSSVVFDLATKNDQPVLWAKGTVTNALPSLKLNFGHKLGKLRIVVNAAVTANPTAVAKVSVVGVLSKGTLDVATGNFTVASDIATLPLIAQNNEFYTYLMPTQVLKDLVIKVEHDGKVYNAKLVTDKIVNAGNYYMYTITLKSGAAEVVIGDGNTVDPVNPGDTGAIDVNPEPTPVTPVDATVTGPNFTSGVLSATADGGSFALTLDGIESTTAVTAKVVETWVSAVTGENVTLTRATTRAITFVVDKNTTTAERTATVTLTAEGMKPYTFTIKQAAATNPGTGETTTYATDLIISEYVEGSASNKAIEIYNGTGKTVNLAEYTLKMENYRGSDLTDKPGVIKERKLEGSLEHGKTLVIANSGASFFSAISSNNGNVISDNSVINFNGNDGVFLFKGEEQIDALGTFGKVSVFGVDKTLVRKSSVKSPSATFDSNQWNDLGKDVFTDLGKYTMD